MKLQWHPSSGKRTVFSIALNGAPAFLLTAAVAVAALLWLTLPLAVGAVLERWQRWRAETEAAILNARRREALDLATSALRETSERLAADRDRLARIAYLYELSTLARRIAAPSAPAPSAESTLDASERIVASLADSVASIEDFERRHPEVPAVTPSISPIPEAASVPTGEFGWRVSRITGRSEFSPGIDLAAARGRTVLATADGTIRWTGPVSFRGPGPYFRFGKIVTIRHGDRSVTLYGNLDSIAVRRGARIRRGDRIGTVGDSPWFGAPRLRYEVWKISAGEASPVDPRLAILTDRTAEALEEILRSPRRSVHAEVALPAEFR